MFPQTPQNRVLFPRALAIATAGGFVVLTLLLATGGFLLRPQSVHAATTNSTLNFQARLENTAGNIVADGYYNVEFKLYNVSSAGSALWTETYYDTDGATPGNDFRIQVRNGYLTANLGSRTAFPGTINWDQDLWITLNIGGTTQTATPSWDGEMNPRLKLTGVPYAFKAGQLATTNTAGTLTSTLSILQPTVGNQVFQIQDQGAAGTYNLCVQNSTSCGFAAATGATGYIHNQSGSQQTSSAFWISGTGRADTALQAPSFDTPTAVALNIGTTNATSITLGKVGANTIIGGNLSVGTTQSLGAITIANGAWFSAVDAAGTGSVNMFQVNSSNQIQVGAALNIDGGIILPTNGGQMTLVDLGIDSTASSGAKQSYTLRVGSTNALTVYGEADGAGNAQNVRVAVGSSINPAYTLDVGGDVNTSGAYRINGTSICTSSGCTPAAGSGNYIQNGTGVQATSNFNISGTGIAGTALQTPLLDTAAAVALNIGTTNATVINLNENVTVATGKTITMVGDTTANRPASPTAGMLYFDQTTGQLLKYTGTKWQADRDSNTKIVAASNSSQVAKDAADYVADGTGDQTEINNALTAAAGGTVYLLEGTYTIGASISVPNSTTLKGAGGGTVLKLMNNVAADFAIVTNTDQVTGTRITIQDLQIDGNSANQTGDNYNEGILFANVGGGSGASTREGAKIFHVAVYDTLSTGVFLGSSANSTIADSFFRATSYAAIDINGGNGGNTITGNTVREVTADAISITSSNNNVVSANAISGVNSVGDIGIALDTATNNTVTGNTISSINLGVYLSTGANNNVVVGNTINNTNASAIRLNGASKNSVDNNNLQNSGGSTANNAIEAYFNADNNSITDNTIHDSSATATNYAINIVEIGSDSNYLAGNVFGTGTINDLGTGTVYSNQSRAANLGQLTTRTANDAAAFQIQKANGDVLFNVDSANNEVELGKASGINGKLVFNNSGNANTVTLTVAASTAAYDLTLPSAAPTTSQCMRSGTTTAGLMEWGTCGTNYTTAAIDTVANTGQGIGISGSTIFLQSASASHGGVVNTAAQTFAGAKTFNDGLIVASQKTINFVGGLTSQRPAVPSEGMLYFDTDTKRLLTYANGKWQADRTTATKIVAASDSSQAAKDSADYIAAGISSDEDAINSALIALPAGGGVVYLLEGTYVVDGSVMLLNNNSLMGAGVGTVIKLKNAHNLSIDLVRNDNFAAGGNSRITVSNLKLDGNKSNQTAGTQDGFQFERMGSGSGTSAVPGVKIDRVWVENFRNRGATFQNTSSNSSITNSTFQNNTDQGIELGSSATNFSLTNNIIQGNGDDGMSIGGTNHVISGNISQGNGTLGTHYGIILTAGATYISVTGNTISGNSGTGIHIKESYNTITGNNLQGNQDGIEIEFGDGNTVTGNTVVGNTDDGIQVEGDYNTVSGNNVRDAADIGIYLRNANYTTITGNKVHNSGTVTTTSSGIKLEPDSNNNTITGNDITDTAGTGYAIDSSSALNDANYFADNRYSGTGAASINDLGTGSIYANQLNATNQLVNRASGGLTVQNAAGANILTGDYTNSRLVLGQSSTLDGKLTFANSSNTNLVTIVTGVTTGSGYQLTLPTALGSSGDCLKDTTGTGVLGFSSCGSGGSVTLQNAYDSSTAPATILMTDAKNFVITAPDTATDSSVLINLQCATCSSSGGRFAIQDAGVDIFQVNPDGSIRIGTAANNMTFNGTTYRPTLSGDARHTKTIKLAPEYAGAVITGTSTAGTMTSDFCSGTSRKSVNTSICASTEEHTYYQWSATASGEVYDIYINARMPSDFDGFSSSTAISMYGWRTDTTVNSVKLSLYKADGTECGTSGGTEIAGTAAWASTALGGDETACGIAADEEIIWRVRVTADTGDTVRAGAIVLTYLAKF